MSTISTHVLDTVLGKPATEISVRLEKQEGGGWIEMAAGVTDADGRCRDLARDVMPGVFRITFDTGNYWRRTGRASIYPEISITFTCSGEAHYHLPLLLSDNSYTTYRGS
jgi:5-hydroxyisourate hydrolase